MLTGSTGVMGRAAMLELMRHRGEQGYEVTVLARPSKKNRKSLASLQQKGVRVVWGDLTDKDSVAEAVNGQDVVLHVGGLVSPAADVMPRRTLDVNVSGARNVVDAAMAEQNKGREIAVVYIGSVSQYGSRQRPYIWGRAGDAMKAAKFDTYAVSKINAERIVAQSGLRKWVSLRQTGILHAGLLKKSGDPIALHVPMRGVLEWVTDEESGVLLEHVCRPDVPERFWRRFYNIGGGAKSRLTNYEFTGMVLGVLGCPSVEKVFGPRSFVTDNFHGIWYTDSDRLEELMHFRSEELPRDYFSRKLKTLPFYFRLARLAPAFVMRLFMQSVAKKKPLGPASWFESGDTRRIEAFYGSEEAYRAIPGWCDQDLSRPDDEVPVMTDPGYDPEMDPDTLSEDDLRRVAAAHGGAWLGPVADAASQPGKKGEERAESGERRVESGAVSPGDVKHRWKCSEGHIFEATPRLVVSGGHWCPECLMKEADIDYTFATFPGA